MEIIQEIGSYAGLAAVVGLAVLSALYFSQARDVKRLREWAGRAPERAAEPIPGRAAAGAPAGAQAAAGPQAALAPGATPAPAQAGADQKPGEAVPAPGQPAAPARPGPPAPVRAAAAGAAPATASAAAKAAQPSGSNTEAPDQQAAGADAAGPKEAEAGAPAAAASGPNGGAVPAEPAAPGKPAAATPAGQPQAPAAAEAEGEAAEDRERDAATAEGAAAGETPESPADREGAPAPAGAAPAAAGGAAAGASSAPETGAAAGAGAAVSGAAPPAASGAAGAASAGAGAARPAPRPGGGPPAVPGAQVGRPAAEARPPQQTTRILPPYGQTLAGPWYRRIPPRFLVLAIAGVLIVGGAAAFGISELAKEEAPAPRDESAQETPVGGGPAERPKEKAPPVNPGDVTVSVLNGTVVPGLARQYGDRVQSEGFQLGNVTNFTDQTRAESAVLYAPGHEREAEAVGKRLSISQREQIDPQTRILGGDATVVVIVGQDKA
jgi:hypothetical protein